MCTAAAAAWKQPTGVSSNKGRAPASLQRSSGVITTSCTRKPVRLEPLFEDDRFCVNNLVCSCLELSGIVWTCCWSNLCLIFELSFDRKTWAKKPHQKLVKLWKSAKMLLTRLKRLLVSKAAQCVTNLKDSWQFDISLMTAWIHSSNTIVFLCCFQLKCTQPFQDGAAVTAKVEAGLKFSNPSKQFKMQQIQLEQIEYLSWH